jgi:hypothetical protein
MGRGGAAGSIVTHLGWGDDTVTHLSTPSYDPHVPQGASGGSGLRCGLVSGPLCIALAVALLAWNESVVVKQNKLVDLGELVLVEADCDKRDPEHNGCLVHLQGCPVVSGAPLRSFAPGVEPPPGPPPPAPPAGLWATAADGALRLTSTVEYWAWEETAEGSGSSATYSYTESWTTAPQTRWQNPCATADCDGAARYAPHAQPGNVNYEIKNMLAENVKIATQYRIDEDFHAQQYAPAATLGPWSLTPPTIDMLLSNGGKRKDVTAPSCVPLVDAPQECNADPHLRGCYSHVNRDGKFCCLEPLAGSGKGCGADSSSWFPGWSKR